MPIVTGKSHARKIGDKIKRNVLKKKIKEKRVKSAQSVTRNQKVAVNTVEESGFDQEKSVVKSHKEQLDELKATDPEFHKFLLENDENLLEFSDNDEDLNEEMSGSEQEGILSESENDSEHESSNDLEEEMEELGVVVTMEMVSKWNEQLKEGHSLVALKELLSALHCGVVTILTPPDTASSDNQLSLHYQVKGNQVFNAIVIACLRNVRPALDHHLPETNDNSSLKPSGLQNWGHVKALIKPYLTDLLQLLQGVSQASMICALLRHIEGIWRFFPCFPRLLRFLSRDLIRIWSESREEASVLSYLILRRIVASFNDYKLEDIMKRMYLSYVRNSRLTTPFTIQHIQFMCGTFVEFLSHSPALAYQLVFLYTRHLANQLRSAFKGKKATITSWPFLHSLELFTSFLSTLQSEVFFPLVYPISQVCLGVVQLLNAGKYAPTRLHIAKMLIEVSENRGTFIPIAPILLEILESQSITVPRKSATGKLPSLSYTLKLGKAQIGSRSSQTAVLNYTLELLFRLLSLYSSYISFPEIVFPITMKLQKIMKSTPLTWLRHHLKQVIEKTKEVNMKITNDRSSLTFSPKDEDKVRAWEALRKQEKNPLTKFYDTWMTIQQQTVDYEGEELESTEKETEVKISGTKRKCDDSNNTKEKHSQLTNKRINVPEFELSEPMEEDMIEELQFSSDEEQI